MRLSKPFIRLPLRYDAVRLAAEVAQFPPAAWMPHPSGMQGNSAVALVSSGGGDNDSFDGEKRATPHLARCPYTRQLMADFGEVLSRSRFMALEAGCQVGAHVDFNYHWFRRVRIHIPVVTDAQVIFHCGPARLHMAAGECWIFDSWLRHAVVNGSDKRRVHLVIDTSGSSRFWRLVRRVEKEDPAAVGAAAELRPFRPDDDPPLKLERYSASPVMAPGECEALVEDLIADFQSNPANDSRIAVLYAELLRDFVRDWRVLWLQHGDEPAGRAHYLDLIAQARARLHPNRRALTTGSNGIGVNAVFAQRVLNTALADAPPAAG